MMLQSLQVQQLQQMQGQQVKPVQKRTKAACVHCQSAKVACSSMRPCVWCIRHGLQDTCVDAPKKERKRKSPDTDQPLSEITSNTNYNYNLTNYGNVMVPTTQQYTFTTTIDTQLYSPLPVLDDLVDDFSIESILGSTSMMTAPAVSLSLPTTPPSPVPDIPTTTTTTTFGTLSLPMGEPPVCPDASVPVDDFSTIMMGEIKRAQLSMENVALLTQVRTNPHLLPNASIKIPEMLVFECNDLFARALDYNSAQDLIASQITLFDIIYPPLRALLQRRAHKFVHKKTPKIVRTALLQTRIGNTKCCTLVVKSNGTFIKTFILRHANGVPERAARKLECLSALNFAKQKRGTECPFGDDVIKNC